MMTKIDFPIATNLSEAYLKPPSKHRRPTHQVVREPTVDAITNLALQQSQQKTALDSELTGCHIRYKMPTQRNSREKLI